MVRCVVLWWCYGVVVVVCVCVCVCVCGVHAHAYVCVCYYVTANSQLPFVMCKCMYCYDEGDSVLCLGARRVTYLKQLCHSVVPLRGGQLGAT